MLFGAPFKSQLTVCWPKLSDTPGSAKQTVHYFCRLVKGALFGCSIFVLDLIRLFAP
jgi:hypothetical protein